MLNVFTHAYNNVLNVLNVLTRASSSPLSSAGAVNSGFILYSSAASTTGSPLNRHVRASLAHPELPQKYGQVD